MNMDRNTIKLFDVNIDVMNQDLLLNRIDSFLNDSKKHKIMHVNIHTLNVVWKDADLKEILNNSDLVYCDGDGVRLGARFLGFHLPERMTGADWIYDLCNMCEEKGYSIYLLGGKPGVAQEAAQILINRYPRLKITGTQQGYFEKFDGKDNAIIAEINNKSPDILLVGFGSPMQEKWIDNNFKDLNIRIVWAMGAVLDYISGNVSRAPWIMRKYGLEWFYRLILEPNRMWRRYILGNAYFAYKLIKEKTFYLYPN
jgi:N-acetylglucosaminyldiphosphoundecaprenol N-acetyl-beta-D-mannosaminyltransferase